MVPDFASYDKVVVAFSGGKDSLACLLRLLDLGCPREKIELWHHDVDGGPQEKRFMDWPVTAGYCRAVADALKLPLLFSWRQGGFKREMLRNGDGSAPVFFELPGGGLGTQKRSRPQPGVRRKFPQQTSDLSKRWCSAALKIDVARRVFSNDPRFAAGRFLMVTGERREESAARAKYAEIERMETVCNRKRSVEQWRAVIDFSEQQVWDLIAKWKINPHPAYRLGFGRVSCMACIFGLDGQWAAVKELAPAVFNEIAGYEEEFACSIARNGKGVKERASRGLNILDNGASHALKVSSQSEVFSEPVFVESWVMPAGAFKECGGPI